MQGGLEEREPRQTNKEMPAKRVNKANSSPFLYYKACFGHEKINKEAKRKGAV